MAVEVIVKMIATVVRALPNSSTKSKESTPMETVSKEVVESTMMVAVMKEGTVGETGEVEAIINRLSKKLSTKKSMIMIWLVSLRKILSSTVMSTKLLWRLSKRSKMNRIHLNQLLIRDLITKYTKIL